MAVATNSADIEFPITDAWDTAQIQFFAVWTHATTRSANTQVGIVQFPAPLTPPTLTTQEVKFPVGGLRLLIPNGIFQGHVIEGALDNEVTERSLWITLHTGSPGNGGTNEVLSQGGYVAQQIPMSAWSFDPTVNS